MIQIELYTLFPHLIVFVLPKIMYADILVQTIDYISLCLLKLFDLYKL